MLSKDRNSSSDPISIRFDRGAVKGVMDTPAGRILSRGLEARPVESGNGVIIFRLETNAILPPALTIRRRSNEELVQRMYVEDVTSIERDGPLGLVANSQDSSIRIGLQTEYASKKLVSLLDQLVEDVKEASASNADGYEDCSVAREAIRSHD